MARPVIPTSDASARADERCGAATNAQAPTPVRDAHRHEPVAHAGRAPTTPKAPLVSGVSAGALPTATAAAAHHPFVAPSTAPLPTEYRGKSSGEFQRVVPTIAGAAPDANSLIVEAERHLLTLPASDRNRRLLEVAILRRDTALLSGLLEVFRRQAR